MRIFILILFLLLSVTACMFDCPYNLQGVIYDSITKEPLSNVNVAIILNGKVYNDYGWITDSLRIYERKEYIKSHGNNQKWEETSEGNYIRRMQRKGSLMTDSTGFFEITFMTGLCLPVKLIIAKKGYRSIITKELKPCQDLKKIFLVKKE